MNKTGKINIPLYFDNTDKPAAIEAKYILLFKAR